MWYNKYIGIPFKHLGQSPITGLDCFTLCKHIISKEKGITLPYISYEHCNIQEEDWYLKTTKQIFLDIANNDSRWQSVTIPKAFDIILLSIGATNVTNHCALHLGDNKIIQVMTQRNSWISTYSRYYKQYTTGIYRWSMIN